MNMHKKEWDPKLSGPDFQAPAGANNLVKLLTCQLRERPDRDTTGQLTGVDIERLFIFIPLPSEKGDVESRMLGRILDLSLDIKRRSIFGQFGVAPMTGEKEQIAFLRLTRPFQCLEVTVTVILLVATQPLRQRYAKQPLEQIPGQSITVGAQSNRLLEGAHHVWTVKSNIRNRFPQDPIDHFTHCISPGRSTVISILRLELRRNKNNTPDKPRRGVERTLISGVKHHLLK